MYMQACVCFQVDRVTIDRDRQNNGCTYMHRLTFMHFFQVGGGAFMSEARFMDHQRYGVHMF